MAGLVPPCNKVAKLTPHAPRSRPTQTGWKYTKAQPAKNTSNQIKRSASSAQPGRRAPKGKNGDDKPNFRSQDTIKRLKMYNNGKAIRNAEGKVVGGQFMMNDRAGDVKINASTGR